MPETTPQSVPAEPQVIACDLDETLAYNVQEPDKPFNPFLIGPPIPAMVEKVKNAIANGGTVVIFTARLADKENYAKIQQVIRAWTLRHIGVELFSTNEKTPSMKLFLDDKAIGVVPNEGKFKTASTPLSEDKEQVAQALAEAAPYGTVYNRDISEALKSVGLPSRKETTTFKEVAERARELAKVTWESHQNQKQEELKASPEWVSAAEEMKRCYMDEWEEFTSEQKDSIIEDEYNRVEEEKEEDRLDTEQREERDRIDYENYTKSVAFMDENVEDVTQILEQRGLAYTVQGSNGYSRYITVDLPDEYLMIRVSDHSQPVEIFRGREIPVGGYNEESGERHEAADISIDPEGKTPEDVKRLLEDKGYSMSKTAKEYGDLYHGTTQDFEAFSLEKQSPNSWYGHAFFFTSDYSDAKQYANPENADLASRLGYMVDKLCENDPKLTRAEALEQAKKEAVGSNPNVKRVRLHMDNPVIVGKGGTVFTRDSKLEDAVRRVARHHGLIFSMDIDMLWKTLTEEILNDNPTFTALEFEMSVRKLDDYVIGHKINHIYQLVVDIYKELGFDGIIMTPRVAFQGRGLKFPAGVKHYVVWDASQITGEGTDKVGSKTAAAPTGFDINDVKIQRGGKDYSNTWFATWHGKRIGWACFFGQFGEEELAKDERCIWKSNVLEEYRRAGVATKLYDAVEEYCKTQGWKLVASPPWVLSEDAFGFWKKRNPETLKADSRTWNAPYIGKELQYKGNTVRLTSLSDKGGVAEFLVPQKSTTSWGQEVEHTTTWVPSSVVFEQLGLPNKTASTYEPGLLYRSPETPDRNNDYDPQWDYEVNEQPNPELAKLALEASQRYYNELKANGSIDRWMLGFEVWAVNLSEYNAVGMYVSGTNDFPVILIDLNAHVGYENQISKTINHELKHAIQESKGEDMDEDDAESDDGFKTASSSSFSDWFSGSKVVDSSGNPMVVWHGVKREHIESYIQQGEVVFIPTFEKFNEEGRTEPGIWFSPDKAVASKYGVPVPFYLNIQNPMQEESPLCKKPEGHDGVFRIRGKGEGIQDAWEIAVFSANQIRRAKPVQEGATPPRFTANLLQKRAKSIVEELKNQKLDETVVQNILNTDPTPEKSYSLWLASQLKKKQIRLPEDSNQLKTQLQEFTKIKRSPTFTGAKDINKYSIGDLYEITQKKDVEVSKTQQVKDLIEKGNANAKIVAKEGAFTLYEVTGAEEVTILGSNTNWCTTQLEAAEDNLSKGPIFIGYYQGNPYLQFNSEQCLNKKNEEVGDDKIAYTLLEMGFKHKIQATHFWVAGNPNALPASLALLAKDNDADVRLYVALNPNTPPDLLALLAKDNDEGVRRYVARNPNALPASLALLAKDADRNVRCSVARNPNALPASLVLLSKDDDASVRRYVASNPNTPSDLLAKTSALATPLNSKTASKIGPVYHGTTQDFDEFKRNKGLRSGFLGSTLETDVFAFFFTESRHQALAWARNRQLHTKQPARIITANLTMDNLLDLTDPNWTQQPISRPPLPLHKSEESDPDNIYEDYSEELSETTGLLDYLVNYLLVDDMSTQEWNELGICISDYTKEDKSIGVKAFLESGFKAYDLFDNKKVSDALRYLGFDGAKVPEGDDYEFGGESWCVFSSNQVQIVSNKVVDGGKKASDKKVRAFHGTTQNFDTFETPAMFHIRRKYCEDLIADQPNGHIVEAILTIQNPADLDALHVSPSDPDFKLIAAELKSQGYDGAQYKNEAWVAFKPEQIEVVNSKTAATTETNYNSDTPLFDQIVKEQGLESGGNFAVLKKPISLYHAATPENADSIKNQGLKPNNGKVFLGLKETCARFRATKTPVVFEVIVPAGTVIYDTDFENDEIFVKVPLKGVRLVGKKEIDLKTAATSGIPTLEQFLKAVHGAGEFFDAFLAYDCGLANLEEFLGLCPIKGGDQNFNTIWDWYKNKAITEWIPTRFKAVCDDLRTLQFPLTVYRGLEIPTGKSLNPEKLGIYWSSEESGATPHWHDEEGQSLTLRAVIPATAVNWIQTIKARMHPFTGDCESEITLKRVKLTNAAYYDESSKVWVPLIEGAQLSVTASSKTALNIETGYDSGQDKQVDSPEFKAWFGNSKIVDSHGRPLLMYHGTPHDFDEFEIGYNTVSLIWFTPSPELAEYIANDRRWTQAEDEAEQMTSGPNIMPCYIKASNPFDPWSVEGRVLMKKQEQIDLAEHRIDDLNFGHYSEFENSKFIEELRTLGYDAIWMKEKRKHDTLAVFNPNQIKSAIGNGGKFDSNSKNITASRQWKPDEMEREARCWEDQFPLDSPGAGPASKYEWKQVDNFPVSNLPGTREEEEKWWNREKRWAAEDGREEYYDDMEKWWTTNPDEEMVVVEGSDGKYYVWEGTHRCAISKAHDMKTVPVLLGTLKVKGIVGEKEITKSGAKSLNPPLLKSKTASQLNILYHVTPTSKVPSILKNGLLLFQTSNWVVQNSKERYGSGEIYAMENEEDALRWAGKMDWEFNKGVGTGKISIVRLNKGEEQWEVDTNDPLSQYGAKGKWLKCNAQIPASQIIDSYPVSADMMRTLIQKKGAAEQGDLFPEGTLPETDITTSPKFKAWFAGSKIVEGGKPKLVYHGSSENFKEFQDGKTIHFTDRESNAASYAQGYMRTEDGHSYSAYLSMENPINLCKPGETQRVYEETGNWVDEDVILDPDLLAEMDWSGTPYDGIIAFHEQGGGVKDGALEYIVFDPGQVWIVKNEEHKGKTGSGVITPNLIKRGAQTRTPQDDLISWVADVIAENCDERHYGLRFLTQDNRVSVGQTLGNSWHDAETTSGWYEEEDKQPGDVELNGICCFEIQSSDECSIEEACYAARAYGFSTDPQYVQVAVIGGYYSNEGEGLDGVLYGIPEQGAICIPEARVLGVRETHPEAKTGSVTNYVAGQLLSIGDSKPMGYLPLSVIEEEGYKIPELEESLNQRQINSILSHRGNIASGALYAYSQTALQKLLDKNMKTLTAAYWPTTAKEFVERVIKTTVRQETQPELYRVIGLAFNDARFRTASKKVVPTAHYIEVPKSAREPFWEEPAPGSWEFWAFKSRPNVLKGEKIIFTFDKKPVAETICALIEEPGKSSCSTTGKYTKHHKLFWDPKDFKKYKTPTK